MGPQADPIQHAASLVALADTVRAHGWKVDPHTLARVGVIVQRAASLPAHRAVDLLVAALASPDRAPAQLRPVITTWVDQWWPQDQPEPELDPGTASERAPAALPPLLRRRRPRSRAFAWSDIDREVWPLVVALLLFLLVPVLAPAPVLYEPPPPIAHFDADNDGHDTRTDCDDLNPQRFPGNLEVPGDGIDQDCDQHDGPPPAEDLTRPTTVAIDRPAFKLTPAPSQVPWTALTLLAFVLTGALAAWETLRRRVLLRAPITRPEASVARTPADREVLLLDPHQQLAAARTVERRQAHEPSTRLHADRTVEATTRAAGIPTLRFHQDRHWLGAWIWLQEMNLDEPEAERLAADLHLSLQRSGVPVRSSRYRTVPDQLDDGRDTRSPLTASEDDRAAWVIVLQRCEDLLDWLGGREHSSEGTQLLRALAGFRHLTVVGFGPGFPALRAALERHGVRAVPAAELLRVITDSIGAPPELPSADLRRWQEALAVLPAEVSHADALRLRRHFGLHVSPLLWPRVDDDRPAGAALSWTGAQRARHLNRLAGSAEHPIRLTAAHAWWREVIERRLREAPDEHEQVTAALLDLWDRPAQAAAALTRLAARHERRIRRALSLCVPGDLEVQGEAIRLRWTVTDHPAPYAALRRLGLGDALVKVVVTTIYPGRRWVGAAALAGLAFAAVLHGARDWGADLPEPTCVSLDAQVSCACSEAACIAITRHELLWRELSPGEAAQVTPERTEAPCIEDRDGLTVHRCTSEGRLVNTDALLDRRPLPTAFLLATTDPAANDVAAALLDAGTADLVLITADAITLPIASVHRFIELADGAGVVSRVPNRFTVTSWPNLATRLTSLPADTTLGALPGLTAHMPIDLSGETNRSLAFAPTSPSANLKDAPVLRAPTCNNNVLEPGEACDAGPANSDTTPDACRTDCTLPRCGDGVTDRGEACDGPGCRPDCSAPIACGDEIVDPGEACDDGERNANGTPGACRTDCTIEACGDGTLDPDEACDPTVPSSGPCRPDCTTPRCGDRTVDPGEACDDGRANSDTLADACRLACAFPTCGDGVTDRGEACDGGPDCTADCRLPVPAACGDNRLDPGEQCDLGSERNARAIDCNPDCRLPQVNVPGGLYTIGAAPPAGQAPTAPHEPTWKLRTAAFTMQRTEVTEALYAQLLGGEPTTSLLPATGVRRADAERFCAKVGGRLPTEAEWEAAARSITTPGAPELWDTNPNLPGMAGQTGANEVWEVDAGGNPPPILGLSGNAWEWTSDCWEPDIYPDRARGLVGVDSPQNTRCLGTDGILRGAGADAPAASRTLAHREAEPPERPRPTAGFRCVWGGNPRPDDGLRWVHVPEGPHWIGAVPRDRGALDNETPPWLALFTGGFDMLATEVTQAQRREFSGREANDAMPWNAATWFQAAEFCEQRGARLPTEAEWEAAVRGGQKLLWSCGDDPACLGEVAWFEENSGGNPHEVATRRPTRWGLYDLEGNLVEWVQDCYEAEAWKRFDDGTVVTDPGVVDTTSTCGSRVLRGGSYRFRSRVLRSSLRFRFGPSFGSWFIGFRCVRGLRRQ
jgi:formylglycine-generating enzyme required for sulfatase activity